MIKKGAPESNDSPIFEQMLEAAPIQVIRADLDGTVRYMNKASLETFRSIEQYLPIRADEIVGQSIDIFHKNPARHKGIVADPKNLPHRETIEVGPEKLDLLVTAVRSADGTYIGAMTTWEIITKKLAAEQHAEEMQEHERAKAEDVKQKVNQILAVVAAGATEDISQRIQTIQQDAQLSVAAIAEISSIIARINEFQTTIAAAVEEQTTTTNEITRNVTEAAKGAGEIAQTITGVATAADSTTRGASETQTSAGDLSRMASDLSELLAKFTY
ncbi:MAG: hypothetical protein VCC00_04730 [Deltaproteobacteria bacterium]